MAPIIPGSPQDPIAQFGAEVADVLLGSGIRGPELKALMDQLDPKLWGRVSSKARRFERQGLSPDEALRRATASSTSLGLLEQFVRAGQRGPAVKSMAGLGAYGEVSEVAVLDGFEQALGKAADPNRRTRARATRRGPSPGVMVGPIKFPVGAAIGSTVKIRQAIKMQNPKSARVYPKLDGPMSRKDLDALSKTVANVFGGGTMRRPFKSNFRTVILEGKKPIAKAKLPDGTKVAVYTKREGTRTVFSLRKPPRGFWGKVGAAAYWPVKKVGQGLAAAGGAVKDAVEAIADAVCDVASHPAGQMAAAGGAAAYGAPPQAGAQGAQMIAAACGAGTAMPIPPPPPPKPFPIIPVALGGAALVGLYLFTKK